MKHKELEYNELERLLRNWRSLAGDETYDFVGMFHLFRACVLNLMERSTEDDWAEMYELLGPAEREFLAQLVRGFQSQSHQGVT